MQATLAEPALSPPVVVHDMVGALLDAVIVELAVDSPYALVLHDGSCGAARTGLRPALR